MRYSLWGVYINHVVTGAVNPILWTMHYEMIGSFIVFAILLLFRHLTFPVISVVVATALPLINKETSYFSCFLAGLIFAQLRIGGLFTSMQSGRQWPWIALLLALAAFDGLINRLGIFYDRKAFFAITFVFAAWCSKPVCEALRAPVSRLMGVLSFPIYLVHFPVLLSVTSWLILSAHQTGPVSPGTALLITMASLVVSLVAAAIFVPVEVFTKWLGDTTARLFLIRTSAPVEMQSRLHARP